jgi:hypothetical protein
MEPPQPFGQRRVVNDTLVSGTCPFLVSQTGVSSACRRHEDLLRFGIRTHLWAVWSP